MRATELFIQSNLATANQRLGDIDAALPHFRRATDIGIDVLSRPFEDATQASEALHAFAMLCANNGLSEDASATAEKIDLQPIGVGPTARHAALQHVARARFLFIIEGREALNASFESNIQQSIEEFGIRSNPVQIQFAAYVQVLVDFGFPDEAIAVIRARLLDLDYWYLNRIVFDRPETEAAMAAKLESKIEKFNRQAKSQAEKIAALEAQASQAYQTGDHAPAFKAYLDVADMGSINSQFMIGTFYQCAIGCEVDMEKAREYYRYASLRGHIIAQHYFGALLQMGLGGPVDMDTAVYWYSRAAEKGYAPALENFYVGYGQRTYGPPSYCSLIEIKLRAVEAGNMAALPDAMDLFRQQVSTLVRI